MIAQAIGHFRDKAREEEEEEEERGGGGGIRRKEKKKFHKADCSILVVSLQMFLL